MGNRHSLLRGLALWLMPAFMLAAASSSFPALASPGAEGARSEVSAAFSLKQVSVNELLSFLAASHGKVILVNFFAEFCGPCRKEIPELMKLRREIPEKDLLIVGVAIDEKINEAARFIKSLGIQDAYPVFYGGDAVSRAYRIDAIPFNVIYNREGRIEASEAGYVPVSELRKFLMTLIRR